ncbi:rubrerythrin family protein [Siculibacillus lacustris]|uniref:Rubrerythrin family protein n=1 Tax=Siculibacillus lacustris TaxID=1549641 RepID=A0A4Q9VMB3_9HYPH|nr:ferritin family protein [Siculibacillus lacustris]TBW36452.1 rubrerythrin family protein [Siculibacillus lacustris]
MALFGFGKRSFSELGEQEILALAISAEEDDSRIYQAYAEMLRERYPASAAVFDEMAEEENTHRRWLIDLHEQKFGARIPLIRRENVTGFYERRPMWLTQHLSLETIRKEALVMEAQSRRFYLQASKLTTDVAIRKLLGDLAVAEGGHMSLAHRLGLTHLPADVAAEENEAAKRLFLLQYIQPGLVGLMDGSVSTLAPLFAAAFATHDTWQTFLVGIAASIGAGISMGFAEALSDDGALSGRGSPWIRGFVSGAMTTIGGLGHALPYLIPHFWAATGVAAVLVAIELWAISWIRYKYMDTPFLRAAFQIVVGGVLVFLTGILIGSA